MAANPAFAATALHGVAITPATLDTSLTAPTHVATVVASQTNGCRIEQIRFVQIASMASATCINLFIFDGATYWFFDQYSSNNTVNISATTEFVPVDYPYTNLFLPSGSSLVCTTTTTTGQSAWVVHAFGGAF